MTHQRRVLKWREKSPERLIIEASRDKIVEMHKAQMQSRDMMAALGFTLSESAWFAQLSVQGLTRTQLGLGPLGVTPTDAAVIAALPKPDPREPGESGADYLQRHRAVVLECHQANMTVMEIGRFFDMKNISNFLQLAKLNRKALGLPKQWRKNSVAPYALAAFSPVDDAHIRRGHFCGMPAAAIGAVCGRQTQQIKSRAAELGLPKWVEIPCAKTRQKLAREFDTPEAVNALDGDNKTTDLGRKRAAYSRRAAE